MKDRNTARFFDASDDLNLAEFTPAFFEQFLVYKRDMAKSATLTEYRSAIKDLCRLKRIVLPVEYGDDMKQLYSGIKRLEAEQNQSSSPKNSNKQPLTFSLYKELCSSTLTRSDGGVSHLFLTTQWNLMCRFVSVQTLQTRHTSAVCKRRELDGESARRVDSVTGHTAPCTEEVRASGSIQTLSERQFTSPWPKGTTDQD
ncbi:hypothetical protein PC118_g2940 [Phytophthora cactorum]|uniref:Core-binding (CB) domain-containing protein n=1 Tax=Phytophthora cactorum TaxID=29920 RepID=A0A329SPT9_9STRA|nr:hypothetical protein PC115_g2344 [Phytophthora cactorum]KAG2995571.1 hypothetical protein PC118_g2940 [Phytophthora cactorum]KAG3032919.1 hypothetical protein PC120_g2194 [Phytophthora cactorum]RAW38720.1 hypothetical protein PC110_g5056 [Phytophthora cactorum]